MSEPPPQKQLTICIADELGCRVDLEHAASEFDVKVWRKPERLMSVVGPFYTEQDARRFAAYVNELAEESDDD